MFKSRKHGVFAVSEEVVVSIPVGRKDKRRDALTISDALETIYQQMRISGNHPRTIESYSYIFNQFTDMSLLKYVDEITIDSIYSCLDNLQVSASTKLIRLKPLKQY
ncbi:hypothetical protein [Planococcus sp. MB-3u-03]|uniref:hypothetical protein n=1 Tax=Planococcus sp. MB-3u-03 TaxID=2058136 RepID=UPI001E4C9432|nr:hypothetical protein [Planococcus sp. MB-3u-03]